MTTKLESCAKASVLIKAILLIAYYKMNQKKHLIHSISRFSLFAFISLLGFSSVYAQSVDELSDDQIQQFMKQIQMALQKYL